MSAHLHPCESCGRHVRVASVACPFCASVLSDAFRATPARPQPTRRLSRAATFAFGAALATSAAACGGPTAPGGEPTGPQPQPTQGGTTQPEPVQPDPVAPAYGGPPAAAYGAPPDDGNNVQPLYGVPPDRT